MDGETPGHAVSNVPAVSQDTISITQGALPRAVQPNRPAGTGHSTPKSSLSAIAFFPGERTERNIGRAGRLPPGRCRQRPAARRNAMNCLETDEAILSVGTTFKDSRVTAGRI